MLNCAMNVDVSKRKLWEAIVLPAERARWWSPGIEWDVKVGGRFRESWHDGVLERVTESVVEECYPTDFVTLLWHENVWPPEAFCKVTFALEADGLKARLSVKQEALRGFSSAEWASTCSEFWPAWVELLFSLRGYLHRCEAQSSHDLVFKAELPVPAGEAFSFLTRTPFFAASEVLIEEPAKRLVLAWKGDAVHPLLFVSGNTMVDVVVEKLGQNNCGLRIVHTGFGFSQEWHAAREWQDMAWKKFFTELDDADF
jgi:uncharacterized protein YndB with AHSA1/START domain